MPESPSRSSVLRRSAHLSGAALLAFGLAAPGTAAAETGVEPLAGSHGFLVLVEGQAVLAGNESEGPIAVGGDLTFGSYNVAAHTPGTYVGDGDEQPSALVVNGAVDIDSSEGDLKVLQNGHVKVGDPTGAEISTTDANGAQVATVVSAPGERESTPRISLTARQSEESVTAEAFDVAALFPDYRQRAAGMASCEANLTPVRTGEGTAATVPFGSGANVTLPLASGANIWNVDAADLADLEVITFEDKPSAESPLLVNVDTSGVDGDFAWHTPNMAGIGLAESRYVLFNFGDATGVTFTSESRTLEGTVFAPDARVRWLSPSNIEGAVVAASFEHGSLAEGITGNGELHNGAFEGELPLCPGGEEPGQPESPETAPPAEGPGEPAEEPESEGDTEQETAPSEEPEAGAGTDEQAAADTLPVTGSNLVLLVAAAVAAIAGGIAAFVLGRRKKA